MESGTVVLVDDEPGMLRALTRLLQAEGFAVRSFGSAEAFLEAPRMTGAWCLILDMAMSGMSGLELQSRLHAEGIRAPVVFLTGHGDIPMSVRAIKSGAVDFLTKPVHDEDLLGAVRAALEQAGRLAAEEEQERGLRTRLQKLTPREYEVMQHVITGLLNKQIAQKLGTSEQTIKVHRMRLMEKLGLTSVVELVHAAARLGVPGAP
ncbi:MAG: response regulator transcription factor [Verrucomicrobiota bacterium]